MSEPNQRAPREQRDEEPRDPRDPRRPEDPRDERDERRPGDPRDPRDQPRTIEETDLDLNVALKRFHRLRWISFGVLAAVLTIAVLTGGVVIWHQSDQIAAAQLQLAAGCDFFTDLAALPVDPVPPAKRPSKLGVSIVVDSRTTARGLGCSALPPPSASLRKWAAYYQIPVH